MQPNYLAIFWFTTNKNFDIIKLGPYIEELGPLNNKTTNQRMYKVAYNHYDDGTSGYELEDITHKFWK